VVARGGKRPVLRVQAEKLTQCSGKSAFLAVISRLLEIRHGSVIIDGVDVATIPRNTLHCSLLVLPQDSVLIYGTVRFNLSLRVEALAEQISDEVMIDLLTRVQLWDLIVARGGLDAEISALALSHGQKQLFCLARLLAMAGERRSGILLLDEVTSGVDLKTDRFLHAILKDRFKNFTIITVAHRIESLAGSDRIVVLDEGRIAQVKTLTDRFE